MFVFYLCACEGAVLSSSQVIHPDLQLTPNRYISVFPLLIFFSKMWLDGDRNWKATIKSFLHLKPLNIFPWRWNPDVWFFPHSLFSVTSFRINVRTSVSLLKPAVATVCADGPRMVRRQGSNYYRGCARSWWWRRCSGVSAPLAGERWTQWKYRNIHSSISGTYTSWHHKSVLRWILVCLCHGTVFIICLSVLWGSFD